MVYFCLYNEDIAKHDREGLVGGAAMWGRQEGKRRPLPIWEESSGLKVKGIIIYVHKKSQFGVGVGGGGWGITYNKNFWRGLAGRAFQITELGISETFVKEFYLLNYAIATHPCRIQ